MKEYIGNCVKIIINKIVNKFLIRSSSFLLNLYHMKQDSTHFSKLEFRSIYFKQIVDIVSIN